MTTMATTTASVLAPHAGPTFDLRGEQIRLLADSAATQGAFSLLEDIVSPYYPGPPLHWHATAELFYVLEGTLAVTLDAETITAAPGTCVVIPSGVVHSFSNPTASPARVLVIFAPGGFEQFFVEQAALIAAEPRWPPADMGKLAALTTRHGSFLPTPQPVL